MVRWWLARIGVPLTAFGLVVNCSVDDEGYVFDPATSVGAAGEGGNDSDGAAGKESSGAVSAGGKSSGGQAGDADLPGESGASSALGGSTSKGGSRATGGNGGNSGGSAGVPRDGGAPGEPGGTGGTTTGSGGSSGGSVDCECEDPTCGARVCVPGAPAEWSGPILLFEGAPAWRPECTGEVGDQRFDGGTVPIQDELQCYSCGCGELTGGTCSIPFATYNDSSCQNQTSSVMLTTACNVPLPAPSYAFGEFVFTGTCTPSGGTESSRAGPRWERLARGCGLSDPRSAGCGDDSICMPKPYEPFEDSICVYRVGDHACPSGYPSKRAYSTTLNDERECAPCTCTPSGTCNATSITVYDDQQCSVGSSSESFGLASPGVCRSLDASFSVLALRLTDEFRPPNCTPSTSKIIGRIEAEAPITVCCQ